MNKRRRRQLEKERGKEEGGRKRKATQTKTPEPKASKKQTVEERRAARKRGRQATKDAKKDGTYRRHVKRGKVETDDEGDERENDGPRGTPEPGVYLVPPRGKAEGVKPTRGYYFVHTKDVKKRGYYSVAAYGSWEKALAAAIHESRVRRGLAKAKHASSKADARSGRRGQPPKYKPRRKIEDEASNQDDEGDSPLPVRIGGMRLVRPRSKQGKRRAEIGRYNAKVPAEYARNGKKLDTSFSRGKYKSWQDTRAAVENAVIKHTQECEQAVNEEPKKANQKDKSARGLKKRRGTRKREQKILDRTEEKDESNMPNIWISTPEEEAQEEWWERGIQTREERKRKRQEDKEEIEKAKETEEEPHEGIKETGGSGDAKGPRIPDPFGEEDEDLEEAPEEHEEVMRILAEQAEVKNEYQDELERGWAARQEEQSEKNDGQEISPLIWQLPEEWWEGRPRLRQTPEGHSWCQPPGMHRHTGPKGKGVLRRIAKSYQRDHADTGSQPGRWQPDIDDGEIDKQIEDAEESSTDEPGLDETTNKSHHGGSRGGFDMNISNAGRKAWRSGEEAECEQ